MKKMRKRRRALKPEKRGDFGGRRKSRTECHPGSCKAALQRGGRMEPSMERI